MKRTICKVLFVNALMLIGIITSAQTYNLNSPTGTFSATGTDYSGVKTIIWNINTGSLKPVKINYEIDIVSNTDYVDIYAVTANGEEYMMLTLTGTEMGSVSTVLPTGKAKVRFRINSGYGGNYYDGLAASFSEGSLIETTVNDNVFVNKNLFVLGNTRMGQNASNAGSLNISNTGQYGIHLASTSTNRSAYGIYSTAIGTGNNLNMYGLYSSISSTAKNKWSGYFTGGDLEVAGGKIFTQPANVSRDTTYQGQLVITKPATGAQYINIMRAGQISWSIGMVYNTNKFAIGQATTIESAFTNPSFVIDNINGNVGIGTVSPLYKLDVKGIIRATEVKIVSVDNFPDYVFDKDYKLKSLDELQHFIQNNGHLPEIPSAQDVKENGMSLVEMNVKLLQKVEELTLYVIELKGQIDKLKNKSDL